MAIEKLLSGSVVKAPKSLSPVEPAKARTGTFSHETLIAKREALGFTQKQMAALIGVSSLSVYKWESGRVTPRAAQLERLQAVLKMGVREARAQLANFSAKEPT